MPQAYENAGVSVEAGYEVVKRIKSHVARTNRPGVVSGIGGFGGLFDLASLGYNEPVLISGTDGVCHFYCTRGMGDQRIAITSQASPAAQPNDHFFSALRAESHGSFLGIILPAHGQRLLFIQMQDRMQAHQLFDLLLNVIEPRPWRKHQAQAACAGKSDQAFILCFFQIDAA